MFGFLGVIGGIIGFVLLILCFVALMCIWQNTGQSAKALGELLQYKRIENGRDPLTGKLPEKKEGTQ